MAVEGDRDEEVIVYSTVFMASQDPDEGAIPLAKLIQEGVEALAGTSGACDGVAKCQSDEEDAAHRISEEEVFNGDFEKIMGAVEGGLCWGVIVDWKGHFGVRAIEKVTS